MVSEDDILIAYALRFDGHVHLRDHPFDHHQAYGEYFETDDWKHTSPMEKLTVFFLLQRFLYKWGGEMLPKTSLEWKAFRSLFLQTYQYEIPKEYRHWEFYADWEKEFASNQALHAEIVREIHRTTEYEGPE